MPNKAQQELESLLNASANTITANDALTRLRQSRNRPGVQLPPGDSEAEFATPEALATAVGASFILGPVGGILLGVAQGILGKQEKQNALDAWAAEQGVLEQADSIFNDELERLATTVTNPNDLEQLSAMQSQKDAALRMMMSGSPTLQEEGAKALAAFQTSLNDYAVRQETQRIEAETLDAQLRRELDNQQYNRYTALQDDFTNESQNFVDVMQATDTALNALANGSPADLWAASILVNKSLDPTGIVRQEEAEAVGAMGSLWDKANVILEKARSGETILPEQRRELSDLLNTIRGTVTKHQLAREANYSDQVEDAELPLKYHNNFRLVETTPAADPRPITGTTPAEDVRRVTGLDAASNALVDIAEQAPTLWKRIKDYFNPKSVTPNPNVPRRGESRRRRTSRTALRTN